MKKRSRNSQRSVRRSTRKAVRRSARRSTRKAVRRSARRSTRKAVRRSTRRTARKAARRSARKAVRRSTRRSARKSARKMRSTKRMSGGSLEPDPRQAMAGTRDALALAAGQIPHSSLRDSFSTETHRRFGVAGRKKRRRESPSPSPPLSRADMGLSQHGPGDTIRRFCVDSTQAFTDVVQELVDQLPFELNAETMAQVMAAAGIITHLIGSLSDPSGMPGSLA